MRFRPLLRFAPLLVAALLLAPASSPTAREIGLIRDAEIEHTLYQITNPILEAAGLGRNAVRIYIVQDNQLNAFVAGGMNLFLNTGLLMRTEHSGQLAAMRRRCVELQREVLGRPPEGPLQSGIVKEWKTEMAGYYSTVQRAQRSK